MTEIDKSQQMDPGTTVCNAFGDNYLFAINRNLFESTSANTVFQTQYGESLFQKDTFYVIPGSDSGLLFQYVKKRGIPPGSCYLFVELPHVLALLGDLSSQEAGLQITSDVDWLAQAKAMGAENYALLGQLTLMRSRGVLHGHYPDYPPFWSRLKGEFDAFSWQYALVQNAHYFTMRQIENLTENQVPALCLKDSFRGKTAVLLAGGPSLDELLPWVRQHRESLLVIAVSRVSRALIQAGIQPDISVSIDPQPINLEVSREMLEFQDGTLLVNNTHLTPCLLSSWGGTKVFIGQRYPWSTPQEPENLPPIEGPTVTESAFSIAVETGVAQIVLGGADFCFSQEGYTHASGSTERAIGPRLTLGQQQVETNSGMQADTLTGYLQSAMNVELQALNALSRGCRTINPAAGAMRLPHVEHLVLDTIRVEPLEKPAREVIAAHMPLIDGRGRDRLYKEVLGEVDRVLAELGTIKSLANKALNHNHKLFAKGGTGSGVHNKAKMDHVERQLDSKYAATSTFVKQFGVRRFLHLLGPDQNSQQNIEQKNRLYFQAFAKTSDELLDVLRSARDRIMNRSEEEKAQPDITRLLTQWHRDQQPGRALQWAKGYADYVSNLPETQRQMLQAFQHTFDEILDTINQHYTAGIDGSRKLDFAASIAQVHFNNRDEEALNRLLRGLNVHPDQEQAPYLIAFVQGYIAELRNEPEIAIAAYQGVVKGWAQERALKRLYELHTKAKNVNAALDTLESLSGTDAKFTPMYAELLHATGETDTAVNLYTDYLLAHPDDLTTMMKLGKIFQQCKMAEGVAWTMGYILEKDPENHDAKQALSELGTNAELDKPKISS